VRAANRLGNGGFCTESDLERRVLLLLRRFAQRTIARFSFRALPPLRQEVWLARMEAANVYGQQEEAATATPGRRRARKSPRRPAAAARCAWQAPGLSIAGIVVAALLVIVGLLPTILVHTSLLGSIIRRSANLEGTLSYQSASVGWFTSASVTGN